MPSQLICRPERDRPVGVLRLTGTLDVVTGDALQQSVRRSLAAEPDRLLIDVSRLRIGDPLGLAALSAVVCHNADWPEVPITLCGADRATTSAISEAPECADLEYAPSIRAALAGTAPATSRIRARFRPVPDACRQARTLVTQACEAWQQSDVAGTATLIATELVANVVRHAHTTMEFTLGHHDGRITMAVRDGSRRMPQALDPSLTDPGGRGLRLVRDLSDTWGVLPVPDGKIVWTHLAPILP